MVKVESEGNSINGKKARSYHLHELELISSRQHSTSGSSKPPVVLRAKDRITGGQKRGYRDLLLNLAIPECGNMVVELQLHLKKILEVKEHAHKTYEMHRAVDWDKMSLRGSENSGRFKLPALETM